MPDVSTTAAATAAPESDDIGAAVRAAYEKADTPATPAAEPAAAAPAKVETAPTTVSGDPAAAAMAASKEPETPAAPGTEPQLTPEQKELKARTDRIPVGWKAGAAAWHAQAPEVKQYVADTIRNASQKIEQQAPAVQFANAIGGLFQPYEGLLRARGANPVQTTEYLLNGYVQLLHGTPQQKYEIITNLCQEAGIDLASIQAGDVPKVDPELAALRQQVQHLSGTLQQQQYSAQTAEQAQLQSELQAFESDPAHEFFQQVRGPMGALLLSRQAKDLQDAYDQACWANPEIRNSLVNKRLAQETEKRKKEAEEAQRAAVSLKGAPTSISAAGLGDMDLRASLEHQFQAAGGRV